MGTFPTSSHAESQRRETFRGRAMAGLRALNPVHLQGQAFAGRLTVERVLFAAANGGFHLLLVTGETLRALGVGEIALACRGGYGLTRLRSLGSCTLRRPVDEMKTVLIRMKYIDVEEAAAVLRKSKTTRGEIGVNQAEQLVRITDQPRNVEHLKRILREIDSPPIGGGLYGVVSYSVSQRTQEIGLRMAIGADRPDVLRLVVGGGMKLAVIGVVIGVAGALALSNAIAAMLFEVRPLDLVSYAGTATVLLAVAMVACYVPARRAMRVDPIIALRAD